METSVLGADPAWRWYLIRTKPSSESVALENLQRQGYQVYYPQVLQKKLFRGRWREQCAPLFPRYLFLRLNVSRQSLAPIRSTLGVWDIVRFGAEYAVVPYSVIASLVQRADSLTGLHKLVRPMLSPGATVRFVAGAFAGIEGIFEREVGGDRVAVLFSLLGQEISVRVRARHVIPVCA